MATKIRLQRHGRKNYAFYPIVIADSRAPRDGKFIERIGSYNPNTNPATITLNFERALYWVNVGAQPTDTVRNILSREGVMLMKHLQGGVKKGAFDEAEAQRRFDAWKNQKQAALDKVKAGEADKKAKEAKERLDAEKAKNKAKAEALAKKKLKPSKPQRLPLRLKMQKKLLPQKKALNNRFFRMSNADGHWLPAFFFAHSKNFAGIFSSISSGKATEPTVISQLTEVSH